jgi:hypothetical protein
MTAQDLRTAESGGLDQITELLAGVRGAVDVRAGQVPAQAGSRRGGSENRVISSARERSRRA